MGFPLFMLLILVLTGLIWLVDYLFFQKKRAVGTTEPTTVEYAKSFFPVILLVFLIRSFLAEPFKIPSGSMLPTLLAGDYILVNKYTYGLRLPVLNTVFIDISQPKHGDVAVFHFPPNPKIDYIKRVVGLPGDRIQYQDKRLVINGTLLEVTEFDAADYKMQGESIIRAHHLREQLPGAQHDILVHDIPNRYEPNTLGDELLNGETIVVPDDHYFVMGDNRDNSSDSRVWGFVPNQNLVGKAFFIWFNFDEFARIGNSIH
ncbi:MAG: signal peptidase I [Methylophilaceae bacterium]